LEPKSGSSEQQADDLAKRCIDCVLHNISNEKKRLGRSWWSSGTASKHSFNDTTI